MGSGRRHHNIAVHITKNFENIDIYSSELKKLVEAVCRRFGLSKAAIGIAVVDDAQMRKVNKDFLNRSRTSDCLSFDLSDDKEPRAPRLFELVVNGEMAVREANLRGHSGEAELALYITHGLLHQLGFDDSTRAKAKKMHNAEDEILQLLGYGLVYNKNV